MKKKKNDNKQKTDSKYIRTDEMTQANMCG